MTEIGRECTFWLSYQNMQDDQGNKTKQKNTRNRRITLHDTLHEVVGHVLPPSGEISSWLGRDTKGLYARMA